VPVFPSGRQSRVGSARLPLAAICIAIVALALGYLGLKQYLRTTTGFGNSPTDLLYYDAQLFVLSSPPVDNGQHFPTFLQIARFAAPAVTIYTLFETGRRLFADELALLRARRARNHDVVCGDGPIADALALRLIREHRRLIRIAEHISSEIAVSNLHTVMGDPASPDVIAAAGIRRARTLYVCTASSTANVAVALAVSTIKRPARMDLSIYVHIDDPELCIALQARRLGLASSPRLHISFFSSNELAARTLMIVERPPIRAGREVTFMVVGATTFGVALIVELFRHWRERMHAAGPLTIVVVDPNASAEIKRLTRRYPFLRAACSFIARDLPIDRLLDGDLPDDAPDRVYLCGADEEASLRLALTLDQLWRGGPRSVVGSLRQLGAVVEAFHGVERDQLLDDVSGTLVLFDAVAAGTDSMLVEDSLVERIGRAIHENYVTSRRSIASAAVVPSMLPWSDLPEELRSANRAQSADIGRKLRAIGCVLAPTPIWGEPACLDDEAVEYLAQTEHERWNAYMYEHGWRFGPDRDDSGRRHPDLVAWPDLAEPAREKDRDAVRNMPAILSSVGFQIVALAARADAPL
jgi:voltage-gated potassium channel Kch